MVLSLDRFRGKVAVVTGASSGIGEAIVKKLVEEGLQVVGFARRVERVQQLASKLSAKKGKLHPIKVDITNEQDILKAFEWIATHLGPVHIAINAAGIMKKTSLADGRTKDWKSTIDTNFLGLCIITREAIKNMQLNKIDGHIIHINSIAGLYVPLIGNTNIYSGAKHGVQASTEVLTKELKAIGSKIKVTSVCPGAVDTEFFETGGFEFDLSQNPLLKSEDVASTVLYALSTPPHVQVHLLVVKPMGEAF